jgi:NADPH:quinone reductase-like Zn-dependent oxidoreductase
LAVRSDAPISHSFGCDIHAIEVAGPGGVNALQFVARPAPQAAAGEVVIVVAYAAANWSDIQKREGVYPDPVTYPARRR